jgi:flagellar basal body P-ring formation protein FlgA
MTRTSGSHARGLVVIPLVMILLAAVLGGFAPRAHAAQGKWHFVVRPVVAVAGDTVLFGEIARPVTDYGQELWEKVAEHPLWPAPEQGKTVTFSRERLYGLLRQYLGSSVAAVHLPTQMTLQGGGEVVLEEELRSRLVKFLTPRAQSLGDEVELRDYRLPDYVFLPHSQDKLEMELTSDVQPGRNSLRFQIRSVDGQVVRKLTGTVFIDVWKAVPCAARPLNRGTPLGAEEVVFQRKNLAYLRGQVWDGSGGPWQMTSSVGTDQVIYMSALEALPAVRKGERVMLVYEGEMITLQVQVQALEDGAIGQTIAVRNLQSESDVLARIRDHETVVVR